MIIDRHFLRARLGKMRARGYELLEPLWSLFYLPNWRRQARAKRDTLTKTYIAVTGSAGKSTATYITGALFKSQRPTGVGLYYNNERHVLRYMRKWRDAVEYFVQELSEFPAGTIAAVSETMRPDGALVTAVGFDHRSAFRTLDAVVDQVIPLVRGLPENGFLCLNADDPHVRSLGSHYPGRKVFFGRSPDAELRYANVKCSLEERLSFDLTIVGRERRVKTRFVGTLLLPSIVGSLAAVHASGLDLDKAIDDLASVEPIFNRMSVYNPGDKHTYVFDSYKASFWTVEKMIDDLPNLGGQRRILVLGQVSDISTERSRRYRQLMRRATAHCVVVIGTAEAAPFAEKLKLNEPHLNILAAPTANDVRAILDGEPPSTIVVKGNLMREWLQAYRGILSVSRVDMAEPPTTGEPDELR